MDRDLNVTGGEGDEMILSGAGQGELTSFCQNSAVTPHSMKSGEFD
jgi:hypothetical protein